jgi:hypothetical protein
MIRNWTLAVLATLGAFFFAGIAGALATNAVGFWEIPGAGFCAALAVVVTAYLAAPTHGFLCALCTLAIGMVVAWLLLEPSFYPESYRARAYEPTHVPVIATYLGGVIGLLAAAVLRRRSTTSLPEPSP